MHFHGLLNLSYLNLGKNSIKNVNDFQNSKLECNQVFPNLKYLLVNFYFNTKVNLQVI